VPVDVQQLTAGFCALLQQEI